MRGSFMRATEMPRGSKCWRECRKHKGLAAHDAFCCFVLVFTNASVPFYSLFVAGETLRRSDDFYAPGYDLSFSDEVPYMVISKASVRELSSWLPAPIPFTRFRPNIVLDGGEPFEEDRWRVFTIDGTPEGRDFRCIKPRARCKITTIDQETATVGSEPLATLRNLRSGVKLDLPKPLKFGGFFGMNTLCHASDEFQAAAAKDPTVMNVAVGQEVKVTRRADRVGADLDTLWGA